MAGVSSLDQTKQHVSNVLPAKQKNNNQKIKCQKAPCDSKGYTLVSFNGVNFPCKLRSLLYKALGSQYCKTAICPLKSRRSHMPPHALCFFGIAAQPAVEGSPC